MKRSEIWFLVGIMITVLVTISKSFIGDYVILTDNFYKSCVLFIIGYLFTEKCSSFMSSREVDSKLDILKNKAPFIFPCSAETICIGEAEDGINYLTEIIKEAASIKNTLFIYLTPKQRSFFHDYTITHNDEIVKIITDFIRNGNKWTDIFSLTGGKERLDCLKRSLKENNIEPTLIIKKYHCSILKNDFPLVNFIIIQYAANKSKEVLFGWGLHEAQSNGKVFSSKNLDLVDYFEKYFDSLMHVANAQDIKRLMSL